ncbi:MAG: ribosome maturation factor RimP [Bacteroidota bacterium]
MLQQSIIDQIKRSIVEEYPDVFIVDISYKKGRMGLLSIKIDTDEGISLATCTQVSRSVSRWLDEQELDDDAFRLEVSSPGVGFPLKLRRQYPQNIGRKLRVTLTSGRQEEGTLLKLDEEFLYLEKVKKKKKKYKEEDSIITLPFDDIKESVVVLPF